MELKFVCYEHFPWMLASSNRTFMELKCFILVELHN